jgi:hypothetical protein
MEQDNQRSDPPLGFKVPPGIADRLSALQDAVRARGHHRPSQRVLISALIHGAADDGEVLETDVLGPFRDAYPDESRD